MIFHIDQNASCNWHMYHTGTQEWFFANCILSCVFQRLIFLFSSCISFSEVKFEMGRKETSYPQEKLLPNLISNCLRNDHEHDSLYFSAIISPNDCGCSYYISNAYSQRQLEQKVYHFIRFRLIASVFHLVFSCSFTVRKGR